MKITHLLIKENNTNWIIAEEPKEAEVNTDVRYTAEATLRKIIFEKISTEIRARLTYRFETMTVGQTMAIIEENFIEKTKKRQIEIESVVKKYPNDKGTYYVPLSFGYFLYCGSGSM